MNREHFPKYSDFADEASQNSGGKTENSHWYKIGVGRAHKDLKDISSGCLSLETMTAAKELAALLGRKGSSLPLRSRVRHLANISLYPGRAFGRGLFSYFSFLISSKVTGDC